MIDAATAVFARVAPPLIVVALLLGLWEFLCRKSGATLPPPSRVFSDTKELIFDPFFDRGGIDKGLFWHLSASLQRVAMGYAMAAVVGVALGTLIGQSVWAMRGLDPIFQVLRTVPPLAWLPLSLAAFREGHPVGDLRDLHHRDLAHHHQYRGRYPQHPAGLSQHRRGSAAQSVRVLHARSWCPSAAPYIFTGLRIGIGLSWLAIVAAEMLIGGVGIGFFIWDAWNSSHISEIILALIYVGLVGFMLDRIVAAAASIVTRGTAAN